MSDTFLDGRIPAKFLYDNPAGKRTIAPSIERIRENVSWLAKQDSWIVWHWSEAGQKQPHRGAHPRKQSGWQERGTQASLEEAWTAYQEHDHIHGLGFVFNGTEEEILEDFDNSVNPWAFTVSDECLEDALENDDEPTFFSSSGTGAHRYPVASDAEDTDQHPHEVYIGDDGNNRFAAITGFKISGETHGPDRSARVNELSEEYNEAAAKSVDLREFDFDADPEKIDGDAPVPDAISEAFDGDVPNCIAGLIHVLGTHDPTDPDGAGWGQQTFMRYSHLLMLLASHLHVDPPELAELVASFKSPAIAATQRGDHYKKPAQAEPHGRGVPWDLDYQASKIGSKVVAGDLSPPSLQTIEDHCNVKLGCRCPVHSRSAEPVSALPLEQLAALDPAERRRAAKRRGYDIPETADVQTRVGDAIDAAVGDERMTVIEAPTGAGKSYHASTQPWAGRGGVTGDQPVVLLSDTREHREQNAKKSAAAGVTYRQLRGRTEACPCAAGDHDPRSVEEASEDLQPVTVGGVPISAWFDAQCEGKGVPFSVAHSYADAHNDQGVALPCGGPECLAIAQWEGLPRDDDGETAVDVLHATHQFALVPSLRMATNVVFDELPDFTVDVGEGGDLSHDRVHRMVAAYLDEADALVDTWEAFVSLALAAGQGDDAGAEAQQLQRTIQEGEPRREWYFEAADAHTLAPALTRAIWFALRSEADANGRRAATVPHEPPRLDANAHGDDGWNRNWLRVVLDDQNRLRRLWQSPDLSQARSVVGLDARPALPRWRLNVHPDIDRERVLDTDERALWRFFEQQKTVVQVGDATRPFTSGEYFDEQGTEAVLTELVNEHGDLAAITAASVEAQHRDLLRDAGVSDPKVMHYGEEKSREDFATESALLVNGCIDPGDDMVLDLLSALDKDAQPETVETDAGVERAHGREFVGPDADTAAAVLESVRANHVAQAIGRSGRNPDTDERAVVYVRTDAVPPDLVDLQVPGVEWVYGEKQRRAIEHLRDHPGCTARDIAEATGASKEHVRSTLERLRDRGHVRGRDGAANHGATAWRASSLQNDAGEVDIANSAVWSSYTWELAISSPHTRTGQDAPTPAAESAGPNAELTAFGDPPPG